MIASSSHELGGFAMKKLALTSLILLAFNLPAAAKIDGCFYVKYDTAVLKRHPKLEVGSVALQYAYAGSDEEDHDVLDFKLHKNQRVFGTGIECKGTEKALKCAYTPDEADRTKFGVITLRETATGITVDLSDDLFLTDADGDRFILSVAGNPEHRRFTLKKDKNCGHLF
jgi:hypothetical protein